MDIVAAHLLYGGLGLVLLFVIVMMYALVSNPNMFCLPRKEVPMNTYTTTDGGLSYIITYREDDWLDLPEDRKEHCKSEWLRKAQSSGKRVIALVLTPDPLFPIHGHDKPYVAWSQDIGRPDGIRKRPTPETLRKIVMEYDRGERTSDEVIRWVRDYLGI